MANIPRSLANAQPQLVQHFIDMAAAFDARMALPGNQNLIFQKIYYKKWIFVDLIVEHHNYNVAVL